MTARLHSIAWASAVLAALACCEHPATAQTVSGLGSQREAAILAILRPMLSNDQLMVLGGARLEPEWDPRPEAQEFLRNQVRDTLVAYKRLWEFRHDTDLAMLALFQSPDPLHADESDPEIRDLNTLLWPDCPCLWRQLTQRTSGLRNTAQKPPR